MEAIQALEESVSHLTSFEHEKSNNVDISPAPLIEGAASNGINVIEQCDELESQVAEIPIVLEKTVPSSDCNTIEINNTVAVNEQVEQIGVSEIIFETIVEQEPMKMSEKHNLETHNQNIADLAKNVLPAVSTEISIEPIEMPLELDSLNTDKVQIETGLLVKDEDSEKKIQSVDPPESVVNSSLPVEDAYSNNNILSHLEGENINLDEALASHVNTGENNNAIMKQSQVLNKEELLDILEGKNDVDVASEVEKQLSVNKLQSSLALQQFIELKKRKPKNSKTRSSTVLHDKHSKSLPKKKPKTKLKHSPNTSLDVVSDIVEDWNDDELIEIVIDTSRNHSGECADNTAKDSKGFQETDRNDDSTVDQQNESQDSQNEYNKSIDSNRRAGRVIKKKIIFDPDNPDTFTKSKSKVKENNTEKPQSPVKKIKVEHEPKSKSPVNIKATTWKKPHLKSRQHRLTEVDKLLMDEGAVNMIYQLTPEAAKGKKNMRTKAEVIKKINQSSTPETKEKKFRERRKEPIRYDHEGKKILSNKQRMSLSSSVKSPAGFDEFGAHSADDSIIYRRHSSSSYSSTCMSPRRLSDVEGSIIQNAKLSTLNSSTPVAVPTKPELTNKDPPADIFMSGDADITSDDKIVKKACLNLKKKLNSTLGQALNFNMKRKSDSNEDKPLKQRKSSRITAEGVVPEPKPKFEKLVINIKNKVAEIIISQIACTSYLLNVQTLKELADALTIINNTKSVLVTVLMSEHGELTGLDLSALLTNDLRSRREAAVEIADSVRNVFQCLEEHSKVLLGGVEGVCEGTALAILALCDVAMATDTTIFSWSMNCQQPLIPGLCVLSSTFHTIPAAVVNSMVYSNCRFVGAAVTPRVVSWPTRVTADLRTLATKIIENPVQIMKKRLMHLNRSADIKAAFQKSLVTERDILVDHWCSAEGQELIKARYRSA